MDCDRTVCSLNFGVDIDCDWDYIWLWKTIWFLFQIREILFDNSDHENKILNIPKVGNEKLYLIVYNDCKMASSWLTQFKFSHTNNRLQLRAQFLIIQGESRNMICSETINTECRLNDTEQADVHSRNDLWNERALRRLRFAISERYQYNIERACERAN